MDYFPMLSKGFGTKWTLKYYPGILLEGLRKTVQSSARTDSGVVMTQT
jgi:hypothetical protein